ncbi:MAG: DNA polymerase III subunit gamma/tau [Bacteroidota bacterium]|nr:DNA polymerase III subunit gamma/tau [Bacteroidota bacterium]
MENFIVSARKYRPATFDTVVGQKSITGTLKNAIKNGHLAQAFLFCGPRGVGKTTCARILAKTINCQNLKDNIEACNECESCVSFNNSASFNIHELDAASNNSVDDIRNLVDQVRIPPQVGKYKIYIIDEVHMLSASAFNAFLKTLEEPPAYAKFILATTEKHKIIPTILSRCQIFDFKRIVLEDIASYLAYVAKNEGITAEPNALHIIAQKADGAMRDALSIFDQIVSFAGNQITYQHVIENLNVLDYDYYFKMVDFILQNDTTNVLLTINEIIENGFDGQHFLMGLGEHLRNLLVCMDKATVQLLEVSDDFREKYALQAGKCDIGFLLKALDINNKCDLNYKASNNKRLHLELALMQMCTLSQEGGNSPGTGSKTEIQQKKKPEPISTPKATDKISKPEVAQATKKPESTHSKKITGNSAGLGTISIKKASQKEEEIQKAEEGKESFKPAADFSQEDLAGAWKIYAIRISANNPSFANALTRYKPVLKDDFRIHFKTDNKIFATDQVLLGELLGFLKKELNNHKIEITPEISAQEENNRAYTDREKFDKMAQKNPNLLKLKKDLDLEIDF